MRGGQGENRERASFVKLLGCLFWERKGKNGENGENNGNEETRRTNKDSTISHDGDDDNTRAEEEG